MQDFGREFCQGAVQKFSQRESQDGYRPPVHIGHHSETGDEKELAGFLSNLRLTNGNDSVPTVVADIVDIPANVFAEIMDKRLPYRSVEIKNPKVQEFSSLALMRSVVPYHKLALTQVELTDSPGAAAFWAGRADARFWDKATKKRVCFAEPTDGGGLLFWDQFEFGRQQQVQSRNGQRPMQGEPDGDEDSMLDGLPPEVIEQLMQQLQGGAQQQPMPAGAGIDPETQAALGMNGGGDMTAQLQALGDQIVKGVVGGVAQLMAGNQQPKPATPPPVGNAEPNAGSVQFKDSVAPVSGQVTAVQFNELATRFNTLGAQFAAQSATLADMKKLLDRVAPYVFDMMEADAEASIFAEINRQGNVAAEQKKLAQLGYGDAQIKLATNQVTTKIRPAVLEALNSNVNFSEAGPRLAARVPQLFAEVLGEWKAANVVPAGAPQAGGNRPANVQADGVAPTTFAQPEGGAVLQPAKVTKSDVDRLIAFAPQHAHHFAENNGRAEAMKDLGVLFAEFDAADAQAKARFRGDRIAYAAHRLNESVNF